MTAVPLVVSMLIASIGSMGGSGALGRVGARAVAIAVVFVAALTIGTTVVAEPILARVRIDQAAALALRGPQPASAAPAPTIAQWLIDPARELAEHVEQLLPVFSPHLATLAGMNSAAASTASAPITR